MGPVFVVPGTTLPTQEMDIKYEKKGLTPNFVHLATFDAKIRRGNVDFSFLFIKIRKEVYLNLKKLKR